MSSFETLVGSGHVLPTFFSVSFLSVTVFLIGLYALGRWLLPKPLPGIPYDPKAAKSLWGDLPALKADRDGLARWCSKQLEKLGSPLCQALMGPFTNPVVLVADVGETREMLMGRSDFDRSAYIIDRFPLFGDFHLRMMTGDDWRTSRGWLKDLLTPQYLHNVAGPAIHSSVLKLTELWESKTRMANGRPFSMLGDLKSLALDVILAFHFGDDFQDSALSRQIQYVPQLDHSKLAVGQHNEITFPRAPLHEFSQGLTEVGDRMAAIYTTKWPTGLVSWWARYMSPHYRHFFVAKDNFIRKHIDLALQRSRQDEEAKTGIDHMVYREEKAAVKMDRQPMYGKQIMIDEAYGNLIAGQHTTSAALVWILKYLADYPAVQARLRDELQTVCTAAVQEDRLPTAAEIIKAKTPYLEAVLEETLRLRAAFLIPRDAVRDTELLGHSIPKGTVVLLVCQGPEFSSSPSSHESGNTKPARQYPGCGSKDLMAFDPERWLVQNNNGELEFDGSTYPQLAFGLGIRACWGRRLANLEMRIMTAVLTWKFDFLEVPEALATHDATYDISYRAKQGFLQLRSRGKY